MSEYYTQPQTLPSVDPNEPLWLVRFLGEYIFRKTYVKNVLLLSFILCWLLNFLTIYYFIFKLTVHQVLNFVPTFFFTQYVLLCMYYPIFQTDLLEKLFDVLPRWKYDTAGPSIEKRILKNSKIINLCALINSVLLAVATITCIIPTPDDIDIFFPIYIGYQFSETMGIMMSTTYRTFMISVILVLPVSAYQMTTACFLGKFQNYMVRKFIEKITNTKKKNLEKNYQNRVNKCLKYCIQRHIQLNNFKTNALESMRHQVVSFAILGSLCGVGLVLFYFQFKTKIRNQLIRFVCMGISATCTFIGIIIAGQMTENASEETEHTLKNLKWYTFNKNNAKTYLIFLLNLKPFTIGFSETFTINYELGLSILRTIYSMISVFSNIDLIGKE